jgi:hypothetical protein
MSVVNPREPRRGGGRQETIRSALGSNARTVGYCVMSLIDPAAVAMIAQVIRHLTRR